MALVTGALQGASPIVRWNDLARDSIRFANTPPPLAARQLAIVHLAMFDAVNSLGGPYLPYRPQTNAPKEALAEAAVAGAANTILRFSWPQFTTTYDAELQAQLLALPNGAARETGLAWGRKVAQALQLERDFDGSHTGIDYRPATGAGHWIPTPPLFASALLPQWPAVIPFGLLRAEQFRPAGPPPLDSVEWAAQFNEVKSLGARSSQTRTAEQTEIAWFWADGVGTETPPGHWNEVAAQLTTVENLPLWETARLFALLNLALADAGIATWEAKYVYDWWRPITAIRAAESDGNAATEPDPAWSPLVVTPPFPEHVSGHSTFSAAAASVLEAFHGSDSFRFELRSDSLFQSRRQYLHFSEAAAEAGMSRIYGGIHFASANREGQRLGRAVGRFIAENYLLPRSAVQLSAQSTSGGVVFRWPAGATVETCADLGDGHWETVNTAGKYAATPQESRRFLRFR